MELDLVDFLKVYSGFSDIYILLLFGSSKLKNQGLHRFLYDLE